METASIHWASEAGALTAEQVAAAVAAPERLAALAQHDFTQPLADDDLERILDIVTSTCKVPAAAMTIVTPGAQSFLGSRGLHVRHSDVPDPLAFCAQVVASGRALTVTDATEHPLFASNPHVEAGLVRSAVGVPLLDRDEIPLGALCVYDIVPREFAAEEVELLSAQAQQVRVILSLRQALRAQAALLAAEVEHQQVVRQYQRVLDGVGQVAFTTDAAGHLLWLSPPWESLTGLEMDSCVGRQLIELFDPEDQEGVSAALAQCLQPGDVVRGDSRMRTADGRNVLVSYAISAVGQNGGDGVVGVLTDVREHQRRELGARHDQKLESLGRLSAGIAHEINTPIQFVGDNVRFLESAYDDMMRLLLTYRESLADSSGQVPWDERKRQLAEAEALADVDYLAEEIPLAVQQSREGIDRVASLVQAMKAFSYKEGGARSYADINDALTTTLTVARNELKYVADVHVDFTPLPPVLCQVGDLNQVFLNLLVNAADALEDKGEHGEIRVSTRVEDTMVVVSFADNGTGMPPEVREKIFEPFFTTKEIGRGTGQGLALARAVVIEKHGGTIEVDSELGRGTEFVLRLPIDGPSAGS